MHSSLKGPGGSTKMWWRTSAVLAIGVLTLAACNGDSGAGGTDEEPTDAATSDTASSEGGGAEGAAEIRFSWWGSDERHTVTQEVIDLFMEKNPDITVVPDYTDWGGYWDKLATTVAGGDTPDVMTQEERYLTDYANRGVTADLAALGVDTSMVDASVLDSGTIDGELAGVATGVNAYTIVADPQMFEEAGVEWPDDTTWTWEDFMNIATEISDALGDGVYGVQDFGGNEAGFNIYARQQGESLYAEDGSLGYSDETLEEWYQMLVDLRESGAMPDGARSVEIAEGGPEQSLLGTNSGAMGFWWSNQLGAISSAAGRDLELLRVPGESSGERTGMYYKPAMFYSIAADSEYPDAAAAFVDFLINDPDAGALILSDRGLNANTEVRDSVSGMLDPLEVQASEFLGALSTEIVDGPPAPPTGAADVPEIAGRINEQLLFDTVSPADAAAQFTSEANAAIGQ
ncbi:ABC transporter substrate-binding protein [Demequina globuliformis]|uniref:ABC transporter substrate-binding protein n=1 Tax=Demequina globuliformis TaxID=676202 RepID=UPI000781CC21|nr:extracellular solute-binding protein [Demequina globuliformis]